MDSPPVSEALQKRVIQLTFVVFVLIIVASIWVFVDGLFLKLPSPPGTPATKDAADAYASICTAMRANTTGVYEVVVIKGLVEVFKALITGVLTFILVPRAANAAVAVAASFAEGRLRLAHSIGAERQERGE
jgi:hypothetical protein